MTASSRSSWPAICWIRGLTPPRSPEAAEHLIAAGFNRCGPVHQTSGNVDAAVLRQELLTEMTNGVGAAFLGLTVGCARCHDHKFDPIPQADYYRLQAFFAPPSPKRSTSPRRPSARRISDSMKS